MDTIIAPFRRDLSNLVALSARRFSPEGDVRVGAITILSSVGMTAAIVAGMTIFATAGHDLLPEVNIDPLRPNNNQEIAHGINSLLSGLVLLMLWLRRRSVLDLWLTIVMCAFIIEMLLTSLNTPPRFSVGCYGGRLYGFLSASLVLFVLLYETTSLYALMFCALLAERRERGARLMTWDAVSASIAHEIRQPLSGVTLNAEAGLLWLRRTHPDIGKAEEAFTLIERDGRRAEEIIGKVRAIHQKDAGERIALDIKELVRASLAPMSAELETHQVSVHIDLSERLPRVKGEQVQLQQVLVNLTTNAIDSIAATKGANESCGCDLTVTLRTNVTIAVEDSGGGIESTDMDDMFNPLFTTKGNGMGMGLSICRSIVESHDGRLWATPNRPRGAVFRVSLPAITP
jgi:signal transduction histidine kinase